MVEIVILKCHLPQIILCISNLRHLKSVFTFSCWTRKLELEMFQWVRSSLEFQYAKSTSCRNMWPIGNLLFEVKLNINGWNWIRFFDYFMKKKVAVILDFYPCFQHFVKVFLCFLNTVELSPTSMYKCIMFYLISC